MDIARREVMAGLGASVTLPAFTAESTQTFSPKAMRADLVLLRDAYETLHPGLYRYTTPREMAVRFDALAARCAASRTLADVYLDLSRLLAGVRCGHSSANSTTRRRWSSRRCSTAAGGCRSSSCGSATRWS